METKPARKLPTWVFWTVGIAAIGLVLWQYGQPAIGPFQGERAPDFSVVDLDGQTFHLEAFQGTPVLVNFWATWCLPCLEEMPEIQQVWEEFGDAFHVMAISDEPQHVVENYLADFSYTFPIYLDPGREVGQAYLVHAMPTSLFIDERGIIQARHIGQLSRQQLRDYLGQIISMQ